MSLLCSFFKESVWILVWTCRGPISLILGTQFSLIVGTRFSFLGSWIGSLKHFWKLALMCSAPQKSIFCGADFVLRLPCLRSSTDIERLSYILLKNKWKCDLFREFIALSYSSEVLFVKFSWFLALFVDLFFGYIHFHVGPCCYSWKYHLVVNLISCTCTRLLY